jgi:hypothetical protein
MNEGINKREDADLKYFFGGLGWGVLLGDSSIWQIGPIPLSVNPES